MGGSHEAARGQGTSARSVCPEKPVANNENHVVGDGTYLEHSNAEIYLSNMLAFLLGQNSSSVWDWANTRHTYGEYVFTRAHMYHEMVRCALQLRCHAEEIGAFRHAPNPPFRILHSLPSLAERDPYVRSLYGLYGATSFTGWATRFITERHLAKGDFKGAQVIVVPDARRVSDTTFKALETFARHGRPQATTSRSSRTYHGPQSRCAFPASGRMFLTGIRLCRSD